ncbi:hypothetical protein VTK73DRAFT_3866 [Phialemonium thermophilum]|uniref:DNA topoisomerase I n=1 Tax=Phialemonium thermophilum TaxID=223376 RepID=A0ABR3WWH7_9PEZI
MSSSGSDDDVPLAKTNGHASQARAAAPGLSIRHGPVEDGTMDSNHGPNGLAKRKSRSSIKSVNYKAESDSDDDAPLAKRQKSQHQVLSDSEDEPIAKSKLPPPAKNTSVIHKANGNQSQGAKLAQVRADVEKAAAKEAKAIRAEERQKKPTPKKPVKDEDESDDEPLAKPKKRLSNGVAPAAKRKSTAVKAEADSESDVPLVKKAKKATPAGKAQAAAPAKKSSTPVSKKKVKSEEPEDEGEGEEGEEDEELKWWNAPKKEDDTIKWTTLEHNGVLFPPPYQPLPKNVKLYYDGKAVDLHPEAEEVATFFGSMLHQTQHVENPVFQKNFFGDFKEILEKTGGAKDLSGNKVEIKEFSKLDFKAIYEHYKAQSEAKKARSSAEKKAEKAEKDKREEPYRYCKWDGRREKVANIMVEPPGLFRGRGSHPKTGKVKKRVTPEQVTINIGKEAKVPDPPPGHKWKAVQHDNKATWLAMWQENINGNYKYVMLSADSAIKGQADYKKFEKARELKKHIDRIRRDYQKDLKSDVMADRQRATAMYLIDKFALRAGNEKDTENEAETVGCCSLKYEHVTLREPDIVIFDFLGKDSIRFYNEVQVDRQVFKNLKMFKKPPKEAGDDIFDRLNTSQLNKHLSSYMPGLTAKVFRTYNASYTMSKLLQSLEVKKNMTVAEKIKLYNDCNREVAILCNHKRTVGAAHEVQMEKLSERIKGLRYQKWRHKMMMLNLDPKLKKKEGAEFFERDPDMDEEWVLAHQKSLVEAERTKITKKFQKDNEKRAAEGQPPLPEKELKERLQAASELEAMFKKENKTKKVEPEGRSPSIEKLEASIKKLDERIRTLELQSADREGNKEVALGTSKINYIDPRLTVAFSKKFDVPIEKIFSKTLRDKFNWAIMSVGDDANWEF